MPQVSLDTSFLISFVDPSRPNHAAAVEYFRYCISQNIPMFISVIVAGEFEVKQPVSDLPLQNFHILPYNLPDAIKAAQLFRKLREGNAVAQESRQIVINDLKIIAQAEVEGISIVLTEDENTLSRMASRLLAGGDVSTHVLLLKDGFVPKQLESPEQTELAFPST